MSDVAVRADTELWDELDDDYSLAKKYRETNVEPRWKDVVTLVTPKYGLCGSQPPWYDARYDSMATECSALLGDGMFGNLCPSNMAWFRYQFVNYQMNNDKTAAGVLEKWDEHMINTFNRSTFYDIGPEYLQIGNSIGTASMDIREDKETQSIICSIEHPRAVYCKVNARNEVVETYTVRYLNADQIEDEFGEEALTDNMKANRSSPNNTEYEVVEVCKRRPNGSNDRPLAKEWKYAEYTYIPGDARKRIILESGAKELPKIVWRWSLRGNEPYAWSPIMDCMPDIRTCNQMIKTMLLVKNKQADPAKWLPSEGRTWSSDPGARNYYRDPNRRMIKDEITGYNFDYEALQIMQQRIRKAMKVDHFLMLMQIEATMTAREVLERKREGMSVVASTVGAFETMALDRIHARFLQIEAAAGRLPGYRPGDEPLPPEIANQALRVEYLGPISQQQKQIAVEQGIMSALESSITVFKLWNTTLAKVTPEVLIDKIWNANGAPSEALKTDKEYQKALADAAAAAEEQRKKEMEMEMAKKANPQVAPQPGSMQAQAMQVMRDSQGRISGVAPSAVQQPVAAGGK